MALDLPVAAGDVPGFASDEDAVTIVLVAEQAVNMDGSMTTGQGLRGSEAAGGEYGVTFSVDG